MSQVREKVFVTKAECRQNCREHEQPFYCEYGDRRGWVAARTHPYARGAFALWMGVKCTTEGPAEPPTPEALIAMCTPAQLEQLRAALAAKSE